MVWMLESQQSEFPTLTRFLQGELGKVALDRAKFELFMGYAELTHDEAKARNALRWGFPPTLILQERRAGSMGRFNNNSPNQIILNKTLAEQFEHMGLVGGTPMDATTREKWENLWQKAHLLLEATLLNEIVHWGDYAFDHQHRDFRDHSRGKVFDAGDMFAVKAYKMHSIPDWQNLGLEGWMGWDKNGRPYKTEFGPGQGLVLP